LISATHRLIALAILVLTFMTIAQSQTTVARPPITGVSHLAFFGKNGAASRHFYYDLLRLTPHPTRANVYLVGTRQTIEIEPMPATPPANLLSHIAFATPDAEGMRAYLASRGVKVPAQVSTGGTTKWFEFRDPEDHPLEFVEEQSWTLPATAPADRPVSARIIHGGFTGHDRAALDHFYGDILGFHLYWQGGFKPEFTDWVQMQVPDGTDYLEYIMAHPGDKLDAHTEGVFNHFALGTADFEGAVELLESRGLKAIGDSEPKLGMDGKRQLNLYDPDGTRVEVMDFAPTGKTCCSPYKAPHPKE
jgi:catechol 2,3-dioxygenase-like lactoylglutathione lyase family enzyme